MLTLLINEGELTETINDVVWFVQTPKTELKLEHSLLSISKWESKTKRSFFKDTPASPDDIRLYAKCMTINKNIMDSIYLAITNDQIRQIIDYINTPQTATKIVSRKVGASVETNTYETSEKYYYYMSELGIPFECDRWHFSRLEALIHIAANARNVSNNKMNARETAERHRQLNAARRIEAGYR